MKTIPEQLRLAAGIIERGETYFICHAISAVNGRHHVSGSSLPASKFLQYLGMELSGFAFEAQVIGPDGTHVLKENHFGGSKSALRWAWCLFAADIAEEWGILSDEDVYSFCGLSATGRILHS